MDIGDRVKILGVRMDGLEIYGTVIDPNYLGIGVLVKCDTAVSVQYCATSNKEILFNAEQCLKIR